MRTFLIHGWMGEPKKLTDEVFLDSNRFVHIIYHGDQDKRSGQRTINRVMTIVMRLVRQDSMVNILADIRDMGKHTPNARQVGAHARETMPYRKMAIVVSDTDPYTAKISKIVTSMSSRKKEIGYFKTEELAIEWLSK